MNSETRPVVVCDSSGAPIDVALENEKGYRKSIETGVLWALHGETGRLLPYDDSLPVEIEDRGGWYRATLGTAGSETAGSETAGSETAGSETARSETAGSETAGSAPGAGSAGAPRAERNLSSSAGTAQEPARGEDGDLGEVLDALSRVVRDRHEKMPEGSYTTHLFSAGGAKIRKKTGEEAVELVLSENREEMISETADLLYHLLVLLEHEGIPLDAIAAELRTR